MGKYQKMTKKDENKYVNKIREICTVEERSVSGMRESGKTIHFMPRSLGLTLQEQKWVLNRDW